MNNKQSWFKEPIKSDGAGCICCAQTTDILPVETVLYNGFGGWRVTKNGNTFYLASAKDQWDTVWKISDIETLISDSDPCEYLAILYNPLRGATYQRHCRNNWVLIEKNEGFA